MIHSKEPNHQTSFDKSWVWVVSAALYLFVFIYLAVMKFSEADYFAAVGSWFGAFGVILAAWVAFIQLSELRKSSAFDSLTRVLEPVYEQRFLDASNLIDKTVPFPQTPIALEISKTLDANQKHELSAAIVLLLDQFERLGLFI